MTPQKIRLAGLLIVGICILSALPACGAAPDLARTIDTIARAEATELARLDVAMAGATDQAEVLRLQRCATHVKLASSLALHEAQLAFETDEDVRARLTNLTRDLRLQLDEQQLALPGNYSYDPLAATTTEVPTCVE